MADELRSSIDIRFARRFFKPDDSSWNDFFAKFVPIQFLSWQSWRRSIDQKHPDQGTALRDFSEERLRPVMGNADLLLFFLSLLSRADFDLLLSAGRGKTTLTDEFRTRLMRRHHALWLAAREYSVPLELIRTHPNHRLWEDLEGIRVEEHLLMIDCHALLLARLEKELGSGLLLLRALTRDSEELDDYRIELGPVAP